MFVYLLVLDSLVRQSSNTSGRAADADSVDGDKLNLHESVPSSAMPPTNTVDGAAKLLPHASSIDASVQSELHLRDESISTKCESMSVE